MPTTVNTYSSLKSCAACGGSGQTKANRTVMVEDKGTGRLKTTQLGSGCHVCLGLGVVPKQTKAGVGQ